MKPIANRLDQFVVLFLASLAVYFFSFVSADPDLWGHLRFGEELWHTRILPSRNFYSFTAPDHPWINHEWLSELVFYGIYHYFGSGGLLFFKLAIGLAIVGLLLKISFRRSSQSIFLAIILGLVVSVISPGFMVRPQLFSFLWFTFFLYVFYCYFEEDKNRLWLLPLIMVVWCNSHGGFLIGWGQYTLIILWQILMYVFRDRNVGKSTKVLLLWYLLTTLACFVTPYGHKLLVFLYASLSEPRPIGEWNPVNIWDFTFLRFKVLAVLFAVSLVYPAGWKKRWDMPVVLMTLVFAFRHQRHTPFFAIMVGPFLVEWLTLLASRRKLDIDRFTSAHPASLVLSLSLILFATYHISYATYRYVKAHFQIIVDPLFYPVQAVEFIRSNEIRGDVILPFEWGEYAIWKLYPGCRVSVDGRFRSAYPESVLTDHIFPGNDHEAWERLLSKYQADIILSRQIPFFWEMISVSKEWVYTYSDRVAMVFVRKNQYNEGVLNRFKRGKLVYPERPPSIYFP